MSEIKHHGIIGMKWGVRRYQNKDGTLTAAGRKRYSEGDSKSSDTKTSDRIKSEVNTTKKVSESVKKIDKIMRTPNAENPNARKTPGDNGSIFKAPTTRSTETNEPSLKKASEQMKNTIDTAKNVVDSVRELEKATRKTENQRIDLSDMSDNDLRQKINRELLEQQYNRLFNQTTVSKGRERLNNILDVSGKVLAVGSSAVGIALAIQKLRT